MPERAHEIDCEPMEKLIADMAAGTAPTLTTTTPICFASRVVYCTAITLGACNILENFVPVTPLSQGQSVW